MIWTQKLKLSKLNEGVGFLIRFALVLAGGFAIIHSLSRGAKDTLNGLIALGSTSFAKGLGLTAFILPGHIISIDGFSLSIIFECTAASYIVMFTAAVVTFPASLNWKLYGLFIGLALITLLNLLRIVFLGWFGAHYPDQFSFFHQFVWEGSFLLGVIVIWVLWLRGGAVEAFRRLNLAEKTEKLEGKSKKPEGFTVMVRHRVACMVFFVAATLTTFNFLAQTYMSVVAKVSGWLMYFAGFSEGTIHAKGRFLSFIFPSMKLRWDVAIASFFDIFLFIALVICFSKMESLVRPAIYLLAGVAIIAAIHIGVVTATYMDLRDGMADWEGLNVLESMMPVLPFFIWIFLNASDIISKYHNRRFEGEVL